MHNQVQERQPYRPYSHFIILLVSTLSTVTPHPPGIGVLRSQNEHGCIVFNQTKKTNCQGGVSDMSEAQSKGKNCLDSTSRSICIDHAASSAAVSVPCVCFVNKEVNLVSTTPKQAYHESKPCAAGTRNWENEMPTMSLSSTLYVLLQRLKRSTIFVV